MKYTIFDWRDWTGTSMESRLMRGLLLQMRIVFLRTTNAADLFTLAIQLSRTFITCQSNQDAAQRRENPSRKKSSAVLFCFWALWNFSQIFLSHKSFINVIVIILFDMRQVNYCTKIRFPGYGFLFCCRFGPIPTISSVSSPRTFRFCWPKLHWIQNSTESACSR